MKKSCVMLNKLNILAKSFYNKKVVIYKIPFWNKMIKILNSWFADEMQSEVIFLRLANCLCDFLRAWIPVFYDFPNMIKLKPSSWLDPCSQSVWLSDLMLLFKPCSNDVLLWCDPLCYGSFTTSCSGCHWDVAWSWSEKNVKSIKKIIK